MPDWRARPFPAGEPQALGDGISRGRLRRTAPLAALSARTAGEAVVAGLRGKLTGAERTESERTEFHIHTAERYAELLGRSKGALMKAGQMLSCVSASPAVPAEFQPIYQKALRRLREDAPPMAPELAREALERELSRRTECAFAEFDWEPLAAASIGQVHAARLHDGREVAVKIQYPGVADAIRADLKNAQLLATLLSLLASLYTRRLNADVRDAARDMGGRIAEELDYTFEAANQAEFAERYRGHPFIHVPEVTGELCTGRVLTQELCLGRSWSEALGAEQELRDQWAEAIWRFVYGSHARFGMINADPHPGNYVFHDDGSVSFLDFGCVQHFRREEAEMAVAILRECLRGDVLGTWRACVEAGYWRSSDPVTPEEVFAWWHEPFRYLWDEQPFTITPEYATSWIEQRFSPTGRSANALRYLTMQPDCLAWTRIEVALSSVLAELHATNDWAAILAEYRGEAPVTSMGKLDHAFFAECQVQAVPDRAT
ncbi:MAG TPA: AarF/ABC1/UbiB kinase family protein [Solirubrobacteraceae bacterium]|nr:AarF/ABC1/UbiB kinase family protein [Solirubrobacteraceae bacterium]